MTEETFKKGMALILKTFNLEPDRGTLLVWEMLLQDMMDQDFANAVIHVCRTLERPPQNIAAAIRKAYDAVNASAEEAWGMVLKEIGNTGIHGIPHFDDEATGWAVRAIGWKDICNCPENQMGTVRAHFYRTYESMKRRLAINQTRLLIESRTEVSGLLEGIGKSLPM